MSNDIDTINQSTELAELDRELAEEAREIATALVGSPVISTQGGRFTFPDGHVEEGPLDFVIVDARITKQLWFKEYNDLKPGEPNGLLCAAVGDKTLDRNTLVPFGSAAQKQADACANCDQNKWEVDHSGTRVKVGRCKDGIVFAVMAPDLNTEDVFLLRGSPTSVTEAVKLIQRYKAKYKHPVKAVTKFEFVRTKRGADRVSVSESRPNAMYAQHAPFRYRAAEMLEAVPRWYEGVVSAPAASAAPDKPKGASRSAASV